MLPNLDRYTKLKAKGKITLAKVPGTPVTYTLTRQTIDPDTGDNLTLEVEGPITLAEIDAAVAARNTERNKLNALKADLVALG